MGTELPTLMTDAWLEELLFSPTSSMSLSRPRFMCACASLDTEVECKPEYHRRRRCMLVRPSALLAQLSMGLNFSRTGTFKTCKSILLPSSRVIPTTPQMHRPA
jgi:hypothetical protein